MLYVECLCTMSCYLRGRDLDYLPGMYFINNVLQKLKEMIIAISMPKGGKLSYHEVKGCILRVTTFCIRINVV